MLLHRTYTILGTAFVLLFLTTFTAQAHDGPHITVQRGETLSEIARQHNTDVQTLLTLNELSDVDLIRSGHVLALPAIQTATAQPEIETTTVQPVIETTTVQPGIAEVASTEVISTKVVSTEIVTSVVLSEVTLSTEVVSTEVVSEAVPYKEPVIEAAPPIEHIVQVGEGLGTIASYYGLTANDLVAINDLPNPNLITPGTVLNVDASIIPSVTVSTDNAPITPTEVVTNSQPLEEKWIDVDLSEQIVVAYEGSTPVNRFIISSGLPWTPTVMGEFRIWAKTPIQDMYGGDEEEETDWYIEDVQWVQYFHGDYGFHGAYWHNNFGQPTSRGCINMRNEDAKWLFEWATPQEVQSGWLFSDDENPGTLVVVHE